MGLEQIEIIQDGDVVAVAEISRWKWQRLHLIDYIEIDDMGRIDPECLAEDDCARSILQQIVTDTLETIDLDW